MNTSSWETDAKKETTRGVVAWIAQMLVATAVTGAILFLAAGRINWIGGWAFFGLNLFTQLLSAWILIPRRPDMLAERTKVREGTKGWDRWLAPAVMLFGTLGLILTGGLDARFGWSAPLGNTLWIIGLGVALASQMFVLWAMASNPFFATTVRLQQDRGHQVAMAGPYRLVRHPGYAGSLVYTLVVPVVLGSLWAYLPALITIGLLVVRTALEDRTLQAELPGYAQYARNVHYRLLPGVW